MIKIARHYYLLFLVTGLMVLGLSLAVTAHGQTSTSTPPSSTSTQPTITLFSAKDPNSTNHSINIAWRSSALTDASLDMVCAPDSGPISFNTDKNNYPACDKGGVYAWSNQTSSSITMFPSGNTQPVSVDLTLSLTKNSQLTDSQKITVVFPATPSTQPTITSISPGQGTANTNVTIYGTNLSGASSVEFYTSSSQLVGGLVPSSASSTGVVFTINGIFAANVSPGTYQVGVVTNACAGGCNSNRVGFTLTAPPPLTFSSVSAASSHLTIGTIPVLRFKIKADGPKQVAWKQIQFKVALSGAVVSAVDAVPGASGNVTLKRVGDASNLNIANAYSSLSPTTGQQVVISGVSGGSNVGYVSLLLNSEEVIPAGVEQEYELALHFEVIVTSGNSSANAIVSVHRSETSLVSAATVAQVRASLGTATDAAPSFVWSDYSAVNHSESTADWANGVNVPGLPSASVTLVTVPSGSVATNPSSGIAPLSGVDVTVNAGGIVGDRYVYKFNCNNGDGSYDFTTPNTTWSIYTATDLCNYPDAGTYTVLADVTRYRTATPVGEGAVTSVTNFALTTTVTVGGIVPPPPPPPGGFWSRLGNAIIAVFVAQPSVDLKVKAPWDAPDENYTDGPIQISPGNSLRVSWQSSKVQDCRMNYFGLLPTNLGATAEGQAGEPVSHLGNTDGDSYSYQAPNEEGVMEFEFQCRRDTDGFEISDRVRVNVGALTAGTAGAITPPAPPGGVFSRLRNAITGVFVSPPSVDLKVNGSDGPIQVTPGTKTSLTWNTNKVTDCEYDVFGLITAEGEIGLSSDTANLTVPDESGTIDFVVTCTKESDGLAISDTVRINVEALTAGTAGGITPPPPVPPAKGILERLGDRIGGVFSGAPAVPPSTPPTKSGAIPPSVTPTVPRTPSAICQDKSAANFGGLLPCSYPSRTTPVSTPPSTAPGVKESIKTSPLVTGIAIPSLTNNVLDFGRAHTIAWQYQRGGEVQSPVVYLYLVGEGIDLATGKPIKAYKYIGRASSATKSFTWSVPVDFVRPAEPISDIKFIYRIGIGLSANPADPQIQSTSNPISVPAPSPLITPKLVEPVAPPPPPTLIPTKVAPPPSGILEPELKIAPPPPPPSTISEPTKVLPPPPPLPTVDIKANNSDGPISISSGASATLSWTSTNASSCTTSGWSKGIATSGSQSTGALTSSQTFTISCTGLGGSASDSVGVNVIAKLKLFYNDEELKQIASVLSQLVEAVKKLGELIGGLAAGQ